MWMLLNFIERAKSHVTPEVLMPVIATDLTKRGYKVKEVHGTDRVFIELGGICKADRKILRVQVDGLLLEMPYTDALWFLDEQIIKAPIRNQAGHSYYKIHGRYNCICLLPEQKQTLESLLVSQREDIVEIAHAELDRLYSDLAEARSNGRLEYDDYGYEVRKR